MFGTTMVLQKISAFSRQDCGVFPCLTIRKKEREKTEFKKRNVVPKKRQHSVLMCFGSLKLVFC